MIRSGPLAGLLVLVLAIIASPARAEDRPAGWVDGDGGILKFQVDWDGSGESLVRFRETEEGLLIQIYTSLTFGLGPIKLFRYTLRTDELWRDGKLQRLESAVDENGTQYEVRGKRTDEGFVYEGSKAPAIMPEGTRPTTYWRRDFVEASTLLDTQKGQIMDVGITEIGVEEVKSMGQMRKAVHYSVRGDLDIDIWYDQETDEWSKLAFTVDGRDFEYLRVPSIEADNKKFIPVWDVVD